MNGRAGGRPDRRRGRLRVASRPPGRSRRWPFILICALLVGPLVLGVVTLQALVSQSSFRMQQLVRQNATLQQSYGDLKLEVAELSSPSRIFDEARKLGMQIPLPGQVHPLSPEGSP